MVEPVQIEGTDVTPQHLVEQFHDIYNVPNRIVMGTHSYSANSGWPDNERLTLRYRLITEEYQEFVEALLLRDFIGMVDALGDLVYVIYGTAIECGVDLDEVLNIIQRSNISKLGADGHPIIRDDGKVLKGPNFIAPEAMLYQVLGYPKDSECLDKS